MLRRRLSDAVRALFGCALAWVLFERATHRHTAQFPLHPSIIAASGVIIESETRDAATNLTVRDDRQSALYAIFTRSSTFSPGDRIEFAGPSTPFDGPRNPGGFSASAFAARKHLTAGLREPRIRLLSRVDTHDAYFWPARFRIWAGGAIASYLPREDAAVYTGMLWGDHRALSPERAYQFSATGTSHLLVTAGLHLGFFAGIVRALLRLLTIERKLAAIVTIAAVVCACIVSDAHVPSLRAAIMIVVLLGAEIFGRYVRATRTCAYAFFATLCIDENALYDISWYLSFSCVFTIVYLNAICTEWFCRTNCPRPIAQALALTCTAQIGTLGLIALAFQQISLVAPLANLVAVPLALLALSLAPFLLSASALHVPTAAAAVAVPLHAVLAALLATVSWCSRIPFAVIHLRTPAVASVIVYQATLIFAWYTCSEAATPSLLLRLHALRERIDRLRRQRILRFIFSLHRRRVAALALLFGAGGAIVASAAAAPQTLRVTMLDVGQGDGIVIETPQRHTIVIDTGGRLELRSDTKAESSAELAGARVLLPYLQYRGISYIDVLLLTHPHGDHVGAAAPLLRTMPVGIFMHTKRSYPGRAYLDALDAARSAKVREVFAETGQSLHFEDGVRIEILSPDRSAIYARRNDVNEHSIVLRLSFGGTRMLFTGDAGAETEAKLLASGVDLQADILKVGHHGSAYGSGSEFLKAVSPRIALISAGRNNLFRHPAPATLQRLHEAGIRVFRTDECGAITIEHHDVSTMQACTQP